MAHRPRVRRALGARAACVAGRRRGWRGTTVPAGRVGGDGRGVCKAHVCGVVAGRTERGAADARTRRSTAARVARRGVGRDGRQHGSRCEALFVRGRRRARSGRGGREPLGRGASVDGKRRLVHVQTAGRDRDPSLDQFSVDGYLQDFFGFVFQKYTNGMQRIAIRPRCFTTQNKQSDENMGKETPRYHQVSYKGLPEEETKQNIQGRENTDRLPRHVRDTSPATSRRLGGVGTPAGACGRRAALGAALGRDDRERTRVVTTSAGGELGVHLVRPARRSLGLSRLLLVLGLTASMIRLRGRHRLRRRSPRVKRILGNIPARVGHGVRRPSRRNRSCVRLAFRVRVAPSIVRERLGRIPLLNSIRIDNGTRRSAPVGLDRRTWTAERVALRRILVRRFVLVILLCPAARLEASALFALVRKRRLALIRFLGTFGKAQLLRILGAYTLFANDTVRVAQGRLHSLLVSLPEILRIRRVVVPISRVPRFPCRSAHWLAPSTRRNRVKFPEFALVLYSSDPHSMEFFLHGLGEMDVDSVRVVALRCRSQIGSRIRIRAGSRRAGRAPAGGTQIGDAVRDTLAYRHGGFGRNGEAREIGGMSCTASPSVLSSREPGWCGRNLVSSRRGR